jgi:MerR family copper efflux transcriptional regulator
MEIPGWTCPRCGEPDRAFAPSGRCMDCEAAVQVAPATEEPTYFIGEVAERTGLSLRSLRHYEEAGLVIPAGRTTGGFRIYTDDAVQRVRVIMQMKPLGFSLEEMRLLLTSLDTLQTAGSDEEQAKEQAKETVALFAVLAEERCRHLREQLTIAEAFSSRLGTDIGRS